MILRDATAADAGAIAAFWNPQIRATAVTFNAVEKSVTEIVTLISTRQEAGQAFMVVEVEGQVAGFASYSQFRAGVGYARTMEHTIILGPAAIGRGLGRSLMAAIEAHARGQGVHSMFAGVSGENAAGIAFHAAIGYVPVAVLHQVGFKFGRWMDLHLMQKLL
jgi:L-amino acid N-acyltransferase YncA